MMHSDNLIGKIGKFKKKCLESLAKGCVIVSLSAVPFFSFLNYGCSCQKEQTNQRIELGDDSFYADDSLNDDTEIIDDDNLADDSVTDDDIIDDDTSQQNCITPYSGIRIIENTKFCSGIYNIPSHPDYLGAVIFGASDIELDCNGAVLIGDNVCFGEPPGNDISRCGVLARENFEHIKIKNCVIKNYCVGITLAGIMNSEIHDNYFADNSDTSPGFGDNIQLLLVSGILVHDNTIVGGKNEGIYLDNANGVEIYNNDISSLRGNGVVCGTQGCNLIYIRENNISGTSGDGIDFSNSSGISISSNNIHDCSSNGILLNAVSDSVLTGNIIKNNGNAFVGKGIFSYSDSTGNLIYNNFLQNIKNAEDDGAENSWNTPTQTLGRNILGGVYIGGNYYSDYTGTDSDGNGIGETPYSISGIAGSFDYFPLVGN